METMELSKLPALIAHYTEHKKENPGISFWEFIVLHYENNRHHTEDHEKHSHLPFGAQHHDSSPLQVWYSCINFSIQLSTEPFRSKPINSYVNSVENHFLTSIWQPPRLA